MAFIKGISRIISRFLYKLSIGGFTIIITNIIGNYFGFKVALNIVSSLIVGFLGIPGLILLTVLNIVIYD